PAFKSAEFDQEDKFQDIGADLFEQSRRRGSSSAGGEQIVDQKDAASWFDGIGVDGDGVRAVLEIVALFVGSIRQLAFLADRNKTRLEFQGGRRGKNETARIDANHGIHRTR